jgi:glycosyltransferase involved in cell wall biosynthesis
MVTREYPPFIVGGVGRHTYYLSKYLKKKGIDIKVISFGDPRLNNEDILFVKPSSSIISRESTNIAEDIKIPFDIIRLTGFIKTLLKNDRFDIVHVQEPYVGGLINYEYKVTTIHDTSFGEIKGYLKYFKSESLKRIIFYIMMGYAMEFSSIATSKIIINPSPDVVWEMINVYKVSLEKIRLIPNGVEEPSTNEPDKNSARQMIGVSEDNFIIFTTAQHVARKRIETLIMASKILKEKKFKNFTVLIGGKGPLTEYFKKLVSDLDVQDVVRFIGWISDDKLPLYYKAADVFVISSEYEAGPLTMLEAGIRNVPLIVSNVSSGFMMIARDGIDCLKYRLGDFNDLAEKILLLANDDRLRRRLSRGAREFASLFKWDRIAEKTINVYKEVLAS